MFADITAKLEDLHGIAVEGQRRDNAPDMQNVLNIHLSSGLVALNCTIRAIAKALEGSRS
ncbi:MAG: hypothetical protein WA957_04605 [Alteraurantiacibacter sp.]